MVQPDPDGQLTYVIGVDPGTELSTCRGERGEFLPDAGTHDRAGSGQRYGLVTPATRAQAHGADQSVRLRCFQRATGQRVAYDCGRVIRRWQSARPCGPEEIGHMPSWKEDRHGELSLL